MTRIGTLVTKSMTVLDSTDENRFFEGYLTVEMKDKQGEITVVDELYKVLPIWIDRGAPITDTHSNRVIGKGINFAKTTVEDGGVTYPAIKITGKIHKNYELDTDIWEKIKSGEYKGLSFGGATKANRVPKVMKDGDIAYALTDLEHYEVAVCKDPAVPLALITEFNSVAKATVPSEPRGDGKEVIKCNKWGCYVTKSEGEDEPEYHDESNINKEINDKDIEWFKNQKVGRDKKQHDEESTQGYSTKYPNAKRQNDQKRRFHVVGGVGKGGEDWSNADIPTATVTNTVSQSTQTAKPIKTDKKVGVPENQGGVKINVTPLEGGIADNQYTKNDTPASTGTGGGVRAHIDDASNQDDPIKQTAQVSEKIETLHKGKRCKECGKLESEHGSGSDVDTTLLHKSDVNKVIGAILGGAARLAGGTVESAEKSGYQTEDGNNQLGGQAVPTEKEKLTSSLGAQNKETTVTTDIGKSNYCPSCGQKKTEGMKLDYPETNRAGSLCPNCRQDSQRREADAKGKKESEDIASGLHRDLEERMGKHGIKVRRFS
jgi:hypothetical protein